MSIEKPDLFPNVPDLEYIKHTWPKDRTFEFPLVEPDNIKGGPVLALVNDLQQELSKAWRGNEVRALDEQGNEYQFTLIEEEESVTYLKLEKIEK